MPKSRIRHGSPRRGQLTNAMACILLFLFAPLSERAAAQEVQIDSVGGIDSLRVIERGQPGVDGWDVAELPFLIALAPLYLVEAAAGWLVGRAESSNWGDYLEHYSRELGRRGVYPGVGGQGINSGTGGKLLLGVPRNRRPVWGWVRGGVTVRQYWLAEARLGYQTPTAMTEPVARFSLEAFAQIEHRDQDEFFGIGQGSRLTDQSDYDLDRARVGLDLAGRPRTDVALGLGFSWSRAEAGPGGDGGLPNANETFVSAALPGFGEPQEYLTFSGALEWRRGSAHSLLRAGRWLRAGYSWNASQSSGAADFGRSELSAGMELPFDHRRRSLAFSLRYEALRPSGDGEVAFYRLPALGGFATLPSYRPDRFRDRDLLLAAAEYRYNLWTDPSGGIGLDASFFLRAGQVARDLGDDFRFSRFEASYGLAFSVLTWDTRLARLAIAHGEEGVRALVSLGLGL